MLLSFSWEQPGKLDTPKATRRLRGSTGMKCISGRWVLNGTMEMLCSQPLLASSCNCKTKFRGFQLTWEVSQARNSSALTAFKQNCRYFSLIIIGLPALSLINNYGFLWTFMVSCPLIFLGIMPHCVNPQGCTEAQTSASERRWEPCWVYFHLKRMHTIPIFTSEFNLSTK